MVGALWLEKDRSEGESGESCSTERCGRGQTLEEGASPGEGTPGKSSSLSDMSQPAAGPLAQPGSWADNASGLDATITTALRWACRLWLACYPPQIPDCEQLQG